jgi:hypothetical protein
MAETTKFDPISRRRVFSILGLTLASTVILPSTLLSVSNDAEAQPAGRPDEPETGTERRQERRTGRVKRRKSRRTARQRGRKERREIRRGTPETKEQ